MTQDLIHARLGELSDALTISRGIPTQETVSNGELPVYSVPELRTGAETKRFAHQTSLRNGQWGTAAEEDILIAMEGAVAGEVFVVPDEFPSFVPSQQVAIIRVRDRTRLDPWYLGAFLSLTSSRNQMRSLTRGQKVQRIPLHDLNTVTVPLLPLTAQAPYGQQYRVYQRAIRAHREMSQHLERMCATDTEINFAYMPHSTS